MLKNKHGELRAGWALVLSLLIVFVAQFLIGIFVSLAAIAQLGLDALVNDAEAYALKVSAMVTSPVAMCVMYTMMIGGLLLLFWLLYKRPVKQMGLYLEGWVGQLLFGGLIGVVLMALAVLLLAAFGWAKLTSFSPAGLGRAAFWIGLLHYGFVGFFEELLSRGFMMTALKTTRNRWVILLLPSVIFGLLHFLNANVTPFSLANIALVGLLFAYLFVKTGRIWAPIGLHITWNFFQGFVFGVPVSGSPIPDVALVKPLFTGPEWLTGGAFGIEGGAVCTLVIALGFVFTFFCVKSPEGIDRLWRMDGDLPLTRGGKPADA